MQPMGQDVGLGRCPWNDLAIIPEAAVALIEGDDTGHNARPFSAGALLFPDSRGSCPRPGPGLVMSAWRIQERQGFAALFGIGSRHGSHETPITIWTDPHLLVVDDDERLRALLQRYLATNGYRVSAARSAAEARSLMANMAFDLIILDVMMPGESGLDFAHALRQTSSIPILMLTARGEPSERIEGLERGADDYLAKPFEPRELLLRVNSLLRRVAPAPSQPPKPVKMGAAVFDPEGGRLARAGKPVKLTSAETALLQLFATHAGRPFSRTDLCKRPERGPGTLHRCAGHAPASQDRGRSQTTALSADGSRGGLHAGARSPGCRRTMTVGQFIKRFLPRGLFGRSLIIIIAPVILLLSIVAYIFFERELDITTRSLAQDVAADVALLTTLEDATPTLERDGLRRLSAQQLRYRLTFHDGAQVSAAVRPSDSTIDRALNDVLAQQVSPRRNFVTEAAPATDFDIKVNVHDGVLEIVVPRERVTVVNPDLFIAMVAAASLMLVSASRCCFCAIRCDRLKDWRVPQKVSARAAPFPISSLMAPPRCDVPPRRSSLCANALSAMSTNAPRCWRGSAMTSRPHLPA